MSVVVSLPDSVLRFISRIDAYGTRVSRKFLSPGSDIAAEPVYTSATPVRSSRFLCFIGELWYNDFMLRKMREHSFSAFTHQTTDDFRGWKNNYREYPETLLPLDNETEPDFILIDTAFYNNRRRVFGFEHMHEFIKRKSRNHSIPVVGIDHSDVILSKFQPKDVDFFDMVLKGQGLPKDRDLLNWEIGVRWGLNRKDKIRKIRYRDWTFSPAQIDKIKLSFDLGCAAYGDKIINPPSKQAVCYDVFFIGIFDSLNRLNGLNICRNHFKTAGWLVKTRAGHPVVGIEAWKEDPEISREENVDRLIAETEMLYCEHRKLFRNTRISQRLYRFLARHSRIMPAWSGIGELGMRHYQAFEFGKALVCEDLSYIDTIYPFSDGVNCVFVAELLEDLEEKTTWLLRDTTARCQISETGHRQLCETYRDGDALFKHFFLDHLGISLTKTP